MNNFEYWDKRNGTIYSTVGHWQGGVDVNIQSYSLVGDLMRNCSFMQLHILNATGRLVEKNIADWIEINFMGLSYPDSRIWCNQVSAYSADTSTSVVGAASAAILAADSRAYGGGQTTQTCMNFLKKSYNSFNTVQSFEDITSTAPFKNNKPMIVGFARPIDRDDERLAPYEENQLKLNIPKGEYLKFAYQLSDYLLQHFNLSINSGGYASAFLLDQGFSPEDSYKIKAFSVISGAIACYRNLEGQPPNSFLPLKCTDIKYTGPKIRKVPD